jgi:hypothetical protein
MYFDFTKISKSQCFAQNLTYVKDIVMWALCQATRVKRHKNE